MFEFIKGCWKSLATIVTMIGMVGAIMLLPTYIATPADLKQLKTEVTTEFKKSMELDRNLQRLNNTNENLLRLKIQQRQYPKDMEIKEDIEMLREEKVLLQQKIDTK